MRRISPPVARRTATSITGVIIDTKSAHNATTLNPSGSPMIYLEVDAHAITNAIPVIAPVKNDII